MRRSRKIAEVARILSQRETVTQRVAAAEESPVDSLTRPASPDSNSGPESDGIGRESNLHLTGTKKLVKRVAESLGDRPWTSQEIRRYIQNEVTTSVMTAARAALHVMTEASPEEPVS
jgi:hypothetical protein